MALVDLIGWLAAAAGIVLGLPQVLRLARTRRVDGLSLTAWQAWLVLNLGYTVHGINIGQPPQILTAALSLCSTVPILVLTARGLRRRVLPVLLPGLTGAGILFAVDQIFGPAAFGVLAIIPAVIANAGQSIELIRAPRVVGVSVLFLILGVINQGLWLTWAILVPDIGTITVAAVNGTIAGFNLIWWSLRKLGLRPFPLPAPEIAQRTSVRHQQPQPVHDERPRAAATNLPISERLGPHEGTGGVGRNEATDQPLRQREL